MNSNSASFSKYAIHSLLCAGFLAMPLFLAPPHRDDLGWTESLLLRKIATNVLLILYFYLNYSVILTYLSQKRYILFGFCTLACFAVCNMPGYLAPRGHGFAPPQSGPDFEISSFLFVSIFFLSYSLRVNRRLKHMETEKLNAQVSMLKAQVSPHFLFNTLNSIYAMAVKGAPDTASAIVKLSNMLRYTLTEIERETVPLHDEIKFIENYINLQRYRLGATCVVNYSFDGNTDRHVIIPMALIPFVENAFKYGLSEEEIATIAISIRLNNDRLHLFVSNAKMTKVPKEQSLGIGIENTTSRLLQTYPDKHQLTVSETETQYEVSLTIDLK